MRDADPLIQMLTARPGSVVAITHDGDVAYAGDGVDVYEGDILEAVAHAARHRAEHGSVSVVAPHSEAARALFRAMVAATPPGASITGDFSLHHPDRPTEASWSDRVGGVTIITDPARALPTTAPTVFILDAHSLSETDLRRVAGIVTGAIDPRIIAIGRTPQPTGWGRMVAGAAS